MNEHKWYCDKCKREIKKLTNAWSLRTQNYGFFSTIGDLEKQSYDICNNCIDEFFRDPFKESVQCSKTKLDA